MLESTLPHLGVSEENHMAVAAGCGQAPRNHIQRHRSLPAHEEPGRGGGLPPRTLRQLQQLRTHRRRLAGRQGTRHRLPRQHHKTPPGLERLREHAGAHTEDRRPMHRHLRRIHGEERPVRRGAVRQDGRGNTACVPEGTPAAKARRRLPRDAVRRARTARNTLVVATGGLALPAIRRHLLHIHDTAARRHRQTAGDARRRHKGRICLGLLQGFESIHDSDKQCHRPGENGGHHTGGGGTDTRHKILSAYFRSGTVGELLPRQRPESGRRHSEHCPRTGEIYRGRRREPARGPLPAAQNHAA